MPSTPTSLRASLTSFSLNGLIMASIFFMAGVSLIVVGLLPVLSQIQPLVFFFLFDPQRRDRIHDLENNECANSCQRHSEQNATDLVEELARAARERNDR